MRRLLWFGLLLLAACRPAPAPPPPATPAPVTAEIVATSSGLVVALEVVAGRLFWAEQDGAVWTVSLDAAAAPVQLLQLDVSRRGNEDGLLGIAAAPDFARSGHLFLHYITADDEGKPNEGRISRWTFDGAALRDEQMVVADLPVYPEQLYHFGGALTFGPDGNLYLIQGDTNRVAAARASDDWAGAVLRFAPDGSVPTDNPFYPSPVYARGVRNGFGLAFHPRTGLLFEAENGNSCDDELNVVRPGVDLGWGVHPYDACPYPDTVGVAPLYEWATPVSPAGLLFYEGERLPALAGKLLVCSHNLREIQVVTLGADEETVTAVTSWEVSGVDHPCRVDLAQDDAGWLYSSEGHVIYRIGS
jgi:glucose/arabinose dehydrogenase